LQDFEEQRNMSEVIKV